VRLAKSKVAPLLVIVFDRHGEEVARNARGGNVRGLQAVLLLRVVGNNIDTFISVHRVVVNLGRLLIAIFKLLVGCR